MEEKNKFAVSKPGIQKINNTDQLDRSKMRSMKHLMFDKNRIKGEFDI